LLGAGAGFAASDEGGGAGGAGGAEDGLGGVEDVGAVEEDGDDAPGAAGAGWDVGPKCAGCFSASGSPGLPLVSGTLNDRLLSAVPWNRSVTIR
jgi:hypothetical protein